MAAKPGGTFSIGDLARATGAKPTTIRWYEGEGLLPAPARSEGGHRAYTAAHLERLGLIRHARELGFPMLAVRALLALPAEPEADCASAHAAATAQIAAIDAKLRRLQALRAELARVADACGGGTVADCHILEILGDHAHEGCLDPTHGGGRKRGVRRSGPRAPASQPAMAPVFRRRAGEC